jgi:hypothetical protein
LIGFLFFLPGHNPGCPSLEASLSCSFSSSPSSPTANQQIEKQVILVFSYDFGISLTLFLLDGEKILLRTPRWPYTCDSSTSASQVLVVCVTMSAYH